MSNIVFEYQKTNCGAMLLSKNQVKGFRIKIKINGLIEYESINSFDEILTSKEYQLSKMSIRKIEEIIANNSEIFDINDRLYNGSFDGCGNTFFFSNGNISKTIHALNIQLSIDDGKENSEEYLEKYRENLRQERIVLKVFFEICRILKEENFELTLFSFGEDVNEVESKV